MTTQTPVAVGPAEYECTPCQGGQCGRCNDTDCTCCYGGEQESRL